MLIFSGVLYAVNPLVSQAVGAKEFDRIPRIVRQGFWIGTIAFVPAFLLFWNFEPVLRVLGQEENVVVKSSQYLKAISFGLLPALLSVSLRGFLEGTEHTRPILIISLIGVGMNIFTNDTLMYGRYGLPALGLVGTGIASSIVYTMIFLMTAAYVWKFRTEHSIFSELHRPDRETISELFKVGLPICLTVAFEGCMFTGATYAMGLFRDGGHQLAAHQIALQSASFTFMIPLGIALATCVRVGNFAGAGDREGARRAGRVGMFTAVVAMLPGVIVFAMFGKLVIGAYIDLSLPEHTKVIPAAIVFLQIGALFQLVDGLQVSASNALRGLKQTRAAMTITLIAYWLTGIPACIVLGFIVGLEGRGLWYGLTIGLAAAAVMLTWRFERDFVELKS
jgi:MATE family multidrug resistance protein